MESVSVFDFLFLKDLQVFFSLFIFFTLFQVLIFYNYRKIILPSRLKNISISLQGLYLFYSYALQYSM
jgi:hypothetical protein